MASRAKAKPPKKRQQRATSNIFAMFDQSQIQEYKEAFNIIDHDRVYSIKNFFFVVFLLFYFFH
jgi:Ca2+-binding EF-hand superfamily protein